MSRKEGEVVLKAVLYGCVKCICFSTTGLFTTDSGLSSLLRKGLVDLREEKKPGHLCVRV
jgi:hypothetical protein